MRGDEKGYTLIEILIAIFAATLISYLVFDFYNFQSREYVSQNNLAFAQKTARIALDYLSDLIREAGNGTRASGVLPVIVPKDGGADSDTISILSFSETSTTLSSNMSSSSSALSVYSTSGFHINDWAIVTDGSDTDLFRITWVSGLFRKLYHSPSSLSKAYHKNDTVTKLEYVDYYIEKSDSVTVVTPGFCGGQSQTNPTYATPKLVMRRGISSSPVDILHGIEEIQFRYILADGSITSSPSDPMDIRRVEITVRVRASGGGDREYVREFTTVVSPRNI